MSDLAERVDHAQARIRAHVYETPFVQSRFLEREMGAELWLKCENMQFTGSFKLRGACNKLLALQEAGRTGGVIAASTGNHGAAVAFAARKLGISARIFVPEGAKRGKVSLIQRLGAEIEVRGADSAETEAVARSRAAEEGLEYVSPYNDIDVVAGQGTIAVELARQGPAPDALYVALGGGGLISGVAAACREHLPTTRIIGCSPEPSAVMIHSVQAGRILEEASGPTLSDGTAGGVEPESITFPWVRDLVHELVVVPEEETKRTLKAFLETEEMLIEGAAAMALAAVRMRASEQASGRIGVILCGGNIDIRTLKAVLCP